MQRVRSFRRVEIDYCQAVDKRLNIYNIFRFDLKKGTQDVRRRLKYAGWKSFHSSGVTVGEKIQIADKFLVP